MNRVDIIGYITVNYCNPNGDIDKDNMPRMDNDFGFGYMSDVCLKRSIKDNLSLITENSEEYTEGYKLYINKDYEALETKVNTILNNFDNDEFKELSTAEQAKQIRQTLCEKYADIRFFGGVITTARKTTKFDGQIKGAVQVSMAESLEPISPEQITISRVSVTTEKDSEIKTQELGKKWIIPYAVYRFKCRISAAEADKTGFNEKDLSLLIESIKTMYENNSSASKNNMSVSNLFVFKHNSKLGNCSFETLENCIKITKEQKEIGREKYKITLDKTNIPAEIEVIEL